MDVRATTAVPLVSSARWDRVFSLNDPDFSPTVKTRTLSFFKRLDDCVLGRPTTDVVSVGEKNDRSGTSAGCKELNPGGFERVIEVRTLRKRGRLRQSGLDGGGIPCGRDAQRDSVVDDDDADLGIQRLLRRERPPRGHRIHDWCALHAVRRVDHQNRRETVDRGAGRSNRQGLDGLAVLGYLDLSSP